MTSTNKNTLTIHAMDKETLGILASLPLERQALVKGFILGLLERGGGGMTAQEQLARDRA